MNDKPSYYDLYFEQDVQRDIEKVSEQHAYNFAGHVAQQIALSGCCRVLDIGCGNSRLGFSLATAFAEAEIFTIDTYADSERQFDRSDAPSNLHFALADGNRLPFRDESFDLIVSSWSVSCYGSREFLRDNAPSYIHEVARVIKPTGFASIYPESSHYFLTHGLQQTVESDDAPQYLHKKACDYWEINRRGLSVAFLEYPSRAHIYGPSHPPLTS